MSLCSIKSRIFWRRQNRDRNHYDESAWPVFDPEDGTRGQGLAEKFTMRLRELRRKWCTEWHSACRSECRTMAALRFSSLIEKARNQLRGREAVSHCQQLGLIFVCSLLAGFLGYDQRETFRWNLQGLEALEGNNPVYRLSAAVSALYVVTAAACWFLTREAHYEHFGHKLFFLLLFMVLISFILPVDLFNDVYLQVSRIAGAAHVAIQILCLDSSLAVSIPKAILKRTSAIASSTAAERVLRTASLTVCVASAAFSCVLFALFGGRSCGLHNLLLLLHLLVAACANFAVYCAKGRKLCFTTACVTAYSSWVCFSALSFSPLPQCNPSFGKAMNPALSWLSALYNVLWICTSASVYFKQLVLGQKEKREPCRATLVKYNLAVALTINFLAMHYTSWGYKDVAGKIRESEGGTDWWLWLAFWFVFLIGILLYNVHKRVTEHTHSDSAVEAQTGSRRLHSARSTENCSTSADATVEPPPSSPVSPAPTVRKSRQLRKVPQRKSTQQNRRKLKLGALKKLVPKRLKKRKDN